MKMDKEKLPLPADLRAVMCLFFQLLATAELWHTRPEFSDDTTDETFP